MTEYKSRNNQRRPFRQYELNTEFLNGGEQLLWELTAKEVSETEAELDTSEDTTFSSSEAGSRAKLKPVTVKKGQVSLMLIFTIATFILASVALAVAVAGLP